MAAAAKRAAAIRAFLKLPIPEGDALAPGIGNTVVVVCAYGVPTTPLSFKSSAIPIQSRLMLHIAVLRLVTDSPFCHWQKRRQCV